MVDFDEVGELIEARIPAPGEATGIGGSTSHSWQSKARYWSATQLLLKSLAAVAPGHPGEFAIHASVDVRFVDSEAATNRGVVASLQHIAQIVEVTLDRRSPLRPLD